jgi:tRNA nucleotidyltransferase (CCA-adding enzyme)
MSQTPPRAKDLMSSPVRCLARDATVREAARFLLEHRLSGAPVKDDRGRPIGMCTLRDIAKYFLDPVSTEPASTVSDLMTHRVITTNPDATLEDLRRSMRGHQVHRLLVEDAKRQVVGMVSASDLALRGDQAPAARGGAQDQGPT